MRALEGSVKIVRRFKWDELGLIGVLGAIALLGSLPYLWPVHHFPLASFDSEIVAAFCVAFALLSSGLLSASDASIGWPLPAVLLGLSALAMLQRSLGMLTFSQQATRFWLYAGCLLAAYVLGRRIRATSHAVEVMDWFSAAVLIGGLYSVFVQWLQLLDIERLPIWTADVYKSDVVQTRPFGNLAQANHVGTYIAMSALAALYLSVRKSQTWFVIPSLLVSACGIAMTGSRMGAAFLFIVGVALFAPTALRPHSTRTRRIFLVALIAGYAAGLFAVRTFVGQYDTLARIGQNTLPIRFELWWQAWKIALQHPLLGIGVGEFPAGQYWIARSSPFTIVANHCHNIVLQLSAEFGWVAALAVVGLGLHWALRDLRARIARPDQALAIGIMLLLAIHSMLEFPLWYLYFAIPAALLFALAEPESGASVSLDVRRILPMAGITVLGVAFSYGINYQWIQEAATPLWLEANHFRQRTPEDAFLIISVADSKLFRMEAERLMIELNHPPDEHTNGPMERLARVARLMPVPEVISAYIVKLAKAGRFEEATRHAERLRIFAHDEYPADRDWILDQTRDLGPQTAPLRHLLRQPL